MNNHMRILVKDTATFYRFNPMTSLVLFIPLVLIIIQGIEAEGLAMMTNIKLGNFNQIF